MDDIYEIEITHDVLMEAFNLNREIEFTLHDYLYFAEPSATPSNKRLYKIWDIQTHTCIFEGSPESLLAFSFPGELSLRSNLESFNILYIY